MLNINPPDHLSSCPPFSTGWSCFFNDFQSHTDILPIEHLQMLWFWLSHPLVSTISASFNEQALWLLFLSKSWLLFWLYFLSGGDCVLSPSILTVGYQHPPHSLGHCKSASNGMHNSVELICLILSTRLSLKKFWSIPKSLKNSNDVACYSMKSLTNLNRSVIIN